MINDLFRTYKKIIILLLLLLCSVVFWFYGCRHQQRGQKIVVEWDKKALEGTNGYCYKFKTETVLEVLFLVWRDMLPEIRKCQSH